MVSVTFFKNQKNFFSGFSLSGHAGMGEYGKDIVCASASTMLITTCNAISKFNDKSIDVVENSNKVILTIKEKDEVTSKLIDNLIEELIELERQYPKNIKIYK